MQSAINVVSIPELKKHTPSILLLLTKMPTFELQKNIRKKATESDEKKHGIRNT